MASALLRAVIWRSVVRVPGAAAQAAEAQPREITTAKINLFIADAPVHLIMRFPVPGEPIGRIRPMYYFCLMKSRHLPKVERRRS